MRTRGSETRMPVPKIGSEPSLMGVRLLGKTKRKGATAVRAKCLPESFLSLFSSIRTKTFRKAHGPAEDYISQLPLQPEGPRDHALANEMGEASSALPVAFWGLVFVSPTGTERREHSINIYYSQNTDPTPRARSPPPPPSWERASAAPAPGRPARPRVLRVTSPPWGAPSPPHPPGRLGVTPSPGSWVTLLLASRPRAPGSLAGSTCGC